MANMFKSVLASARAILQRKTVTPTTSTQTITPDSGYDGLEQVTVEAVNLQSKTTTMTPPSPSSWSATTTKLGTVTPDSGYDGLSQVDISIPMLPDGTVLTKGNTSGNYQVYKPPRTGVVFPSSYLYVPKGGSETTLWTNPDTSVQFTNTTVTVSDMSSYDYIKIVCSANRTTDFTEYMAVMPYSFFKEYCNVKRGSSKNAPEFVIAKVTSDNAEVYRQIQYISDTSVWISLCLTRSVSSGSGSSNNNQLIPLRIVGIK